jgi:integrase
MARQPLPLGSWGRIFVGPVIRETKGKRPAYRARAYFRDVDGVTQEIKAEGKTRSAAEASLLVKLRERASARHGGSLKSTDRFSVAADLWLEQLGVRVADGRRSSGTLDTYRRKLDNHILPALGEVRLGEITTALVDSVLQAIKSRVGPPTARSCRSAISGVLGLAVRHGAIATNPVRDVERIPSTPKHRPRALTEDERRDWFAMLARDPHAVEADVPDLTSFLLATGTRIGEALGLLWSDVDLHRGEVAITGQVIRIRGEGLTRVTTKSPAGQRTLVLPRWGLDMLRARAAQGIHDHEPVFCDALGGFRDPNNVRRDLRRARAPRGSHARQELGATLARARKGAGRRRRDVAEGLHWPKTRLELIETGRVRPDVTDVMTLADLYKVDEVVRAELLTLAEVASKAVDTDALAWITSHAFRKTNATILDDAGLSARQIADQLGHARPSMTQDVYMGRSAKNSAAAAALEGAGQTTNPKPKSDGYPDGSRGPSQPEGP